MALVVVRWELLSRRASFLGGLVLSSLPNLLPGTLTHFWFFFLFRFYLLTTRRFIYGSGHIHRMRRGASIPGSGRCLGSTEFEFGWSFTHRRQHLVVLFFPLSYHIPSISTSHHVYQRAGIRVSLCRDRIRKQRQVCQGVSRMANQSVGFTRKRQPSDAIVSSPAHCLKYLDQPHSYSPINLQQY